MKKHYLFLMLLPLLATMFSSPAFAEDPPKAEYDRAIAALNEALEEGIYDFYIVTEVNGTKYFITVDGALAEWNEDDFNDGLFQLSTASGGGLYDTGVLIEGANGHFSNTTLSNNVANLNPGTGVFRLDTGNNRNDWERQVFYMNEEGKIAIRSCNVAYGTSSWNDAGRAFWTYNVADVTPCYTYDPTYVWMLQDEEGNYVGLPQDASIIFPVIESLYTKYEDYVGDDSGDMMNMGDGFGQHNDWDTYRKFLELLDQLDTYYYDMVYDGGVPDGLTLDKANAMVVEADSLFQAVLDSEVPYTVANGYYRIFAHNRYKSTYDESGFVDKAIAASFDKAHKDKIVFSTLNKDRANFLWKLTKSESGDSILMQNAGMGTYISLSSLTDGQLVTTGDVDKAGYVIFDYAGFDYVEPDGIGDDRDIFCIRFTQSERAGNYYFHQNGHGSKTDEDSPWGTYGTDTGTEQEMAFWRRTYDYDPTRSDWWASEWFLEYVPDAEAQELIKDFEVIKNHDLLVTQNNDLRAEVLAALTTAKDVIKTKLITSADQMSSPHSENDLGNRDGGDLSAGVLIDGDKSTYWHSAWQNIPPGPHYVQVADVEDMIGDLEFYICERAGAANDRAAAFTIYGSDDPEAEDEEWVEMAQFDVPNTDAGAESTIPFYVETAYPYIRIACTNTVGSSYSYRIFWHAAEIQIYTVRENPNSQFSSLGEVATTLEEIYNENIAVDDEDITVEIYEALLAAYKTFLAAMVDPTELRNALAAYESVTKLVIEGNNPGQWKDTSIAQDFDALCAEIHAYDKTGRYNAAQNHKYAIMLKAMAKSIAEKANGIVTDKWYRFQYPTEEQYDEYGLDKSGGSSASSYEGQPYQWGNYVVAGSMIYDDVENEDGTTSNTLVDVEALGADDIREGTGMYFIEEDLIEDKDASMFRFVEREQEEGDYTALLQDVKDNMVMALDMSTTYTRGEALITEGSQMTSPCGHHDFEGNGVDGGNISDGVLIDGVASTYWHTEYNGKIRRTPYLDVSFPEPVSGLIQVEVTRRQTTLTYGHIVRMFIQGSNDGENWTSIGYMETPFTEIYETVSSQPIDLGGSYTHLRFTLTRRAGLDLECDPFAESDENKMGTEWTYFHVAEFQIYPLTPNTELSTSGKTLQAAYNAANKVVLKDATAEDLAAATTSYRTYQSEFNAVAGMAVLPKGLDKAPASYAIQNKATGLFVYAAAASSNDVTLRLVPTFFTFSAPGYERSLLHGVNLNGTDITYLHSQNWNHRLVTWNVSTASSNSALIISEADEEYAAPEAFSFYKDIKPGRIYGWCNSVTITPQDAPDEAVAYTMLGRYQNDEGDFLALKAIETIPAGAPAFYIYGDTTDYDAEDDYVEPVKFKMNGDDFVLEGDTINGLIGSLVNHTLKAHEIYFSGNQAVCIGKTGYYLSGPCVALDMPACPNVDPNGDYDFSICLGEEGDTADGVENIPAAIEKVSQPGNVYSMDGKLLRSGATLNSLKSLGKGMYILNGVKVLVK